SVITTGATGFSAGGAAFDMATVTAGTERFSGIQASVTDAALVGVTGVDLQVSGTVKLNNTSRADGERIDWASATDSANDPQDLIPALTLTSALRLHASGSAPMDIGRG